MTDELVLEQTTCTICGRKIIWPRQWEKGKICGKCRKEVCHDLALDTPNYLSVENIIQWVQEQQSE